MAQSKTSKVVSKKHLARLERERRQTRVITIVTVAIIAIVALSIVYGVLNETVLTNYKTIVSVNSDTANVREFQARIKAAREQLVDQYMYYYRLALMFGIDPSTDSSLSQTFTNIQNQLDYPDLLASQVMNAIEEDLLVRQYAAANGITVSETDVENAVRKTYSYFPDGTPSPTPTSTLFAYSTLSAAQLDLVTATPTTAPTFTPTEYPTYTVTPEGSTNPATPVPSATPITEEGYTGLYQEALDHYAAIGFNESMFRTIFFENALYRERVKAMVTADVAHEADKVWARQIVVSDASTATTLLTLLKAGGNFGTLASVYSVDTTKDKGGDMGWFGIGDQISVIETAAFSQPIGEIGMPVLASDGYHIIQVLGHEVRPLTADEYANAVDGAYNTWLQDQLSSATIVTNPDFLTYAPTEPTLLEAFNDLAATETAAAPTLQAQQETQDAILALTPSATPLPPTATP